MRRQAASADRIRIWPTHTLPAAAAADRSNWKGGLALVALRKTTIASREKRGISFRRRRRRRTKVRMSYANVRIWRRRWQLFAQRIVACCPLAYAPSERIPRRRSHSVRFGKQKRLKEQLVASLHQRRYAEIKQGNSLQNSLLSSDDIKLDSF